jgi:hypothetical protein
LPLEFARENEPLAALLGAALQSAGVASSPSAEPITARVLSAPRASLVVCVNETSAAAVRRVVVEGRPRTIPVGAGRARLVLFERGTGKVLAESPGEPIDARKR